MNYTIVVKWCICLFLILDSKYIPLILVYLKPRETIHVTSSHPTADDEVSHNHFFNNLK